ncbi:hypothetical protein KVV02_007107 [Mortierella alpina]|uniref:Uncharacterized protein n=1 Tax=Mortierella alpina TaxID=64518 RepID=A0A9P8IEH3_MORAP|nr:hypothetical protein KVV02_007107 [Mortierella alpina]
MSSRIKGLFSSKKKKDERASTKAHSKELFASSASTSAQRSSVSFTSQTRRAASVGSFTSSTSAFEVQRDGVVSKGESSVDLTLTPSSTAFTVDSSVSNQPQQPPHQHTLSTVAKDSSQSIAASEEDNRAMTTASVVERLDVSISNVAPATAPSQAPVNAVPDSDSKAAAPLLEKEASTKSAPRTSEGPSDSLQSVANQSHLAVNGPSGTHASGDKEALLNPVEASRYSQKQDTSFVEQLSFVSGTHVVEQDNIPGDAVYLNCTTEFFPIDDQDEQVYLDQYSDEGDEFPVLQLKVSKLQKQVREMRKFMRGLVQLQVEQYEPATILIQAWWRGCLVRRELKKQRLLSWHRNPRRKVQKIKYFTRTELHQSCERISTPKASLLVTEDVGAHKETIAAIKLQAVFRSCLVRKRIQAYRDGMRAATVIQARWRGYRTRNLDTRLGVEQLRFRNLKIQKAFGRVSIKLQYLQGRILALEENSLPLHEAQELIHKEIEDMADQIDGLKQDLEQGFKQLDEQVSEEKEQTTIELRTLTERIQKLEVEISTIRSSNSSIEKQVRTLTLELPSGDSLGANKSEQEDEEEDYEVQYDDDGNRIERPPAPKFAKRASLANSVGSQRRSSSSRPIMDTTVTGSPTQMVESPAPLFQPQKRGSIGSIHSQQGHGHGHGHARNLSMSSQPPPSPSFPRAFPASYSPTIANASVPLPESGSGLPNGGRPHSVHYANTSSNSNGNSNNPGPPPRPLTMDSNQLFRFHQNTNQFIPISPSAASTLATAASGLPPTDSKKYVSMDDFEYMQAEVDTLRLNNDKLENMVRELTQRLNSLTSNVGQFYPG